MTTKLYKDPENKMTARERYFKWQAELYYEQLEQYQRALYRIYESTISKKGYRLTKSEMAKISFDALFNKK